MKKGRLESTEEIKANLRKHLDRLPEDERMERLLDIASSYVVCAHIEAVCRKNWWRMYWDLKYERDGLAPEPILLAGELVCAICGESHDLDDLSACDDCGRLVCGGCSVPILDSNGYSWIGLRCDECNGRLDEGKS